jgi:hypothetical protein
VADFAVCCKVDRILVVISGWSYGMLVRIVQFVFLLNFLSATAMALCAKWATPNALRNIFNLRITAEKVRG